MEKINKEEISMYAVVKTRLEEWLKVFIKKINERNLTPNRNCFLDEFEILYENLFLTYAYNQYNKTEYVTITIPLHVIYEDKNKKKKNLKLRNKKQWNHKKIDRKV